MTAPHWERGEESGELVLPIPQKLSLCALGGSVGTPPEGVEADVVEVDVARGRRRARREGEGEDRPHLEGHGAQRRRRGYGATVPIRSNGASRAAKVGAVAVVIRSVGTSNARFPHTGAMRYDDGVAKIPAAALAIPDADLLHRTCRRGRACG